MRKTVDTLGSKTEKEMEKGGFEKKVENRAFVGYGHGHKNPFIRDLECHGFYKTSDYRKKKNEYFEQYNSDIPEEVFRLTKRFKDLIREMVDFEDLLGKSASVKSIMEIEDKEAFYQMNFFEFLVDLAGGDNPSLKIIFGADFYYRYCGEVDKSIKKNSTEYSKQMPYVLIMAHLFDEMRSNGFVRNNSTEPDSFKYRLLSCYQDLGISVLNDDLIMKKPNSGFKYATYIRKLYGWVGNLNKIENHSKY